LKKICEQQEIQTLKHQ